MSCTVYDAHALKALVDCADPAALNAASNESSSTSGGLSMLHSTTSHFARTARRHGKKSKGKGKGKGKGNGKGKKRSFDKEMEAKKVLRNREYWREQSRLQLESSKQIKERLERRKEQRRVLFEKRFDAIMHGNDFIKDVHNTLALHDQMAQRKRENLYRQWEEKVFQPIQRQIKTQMDRRDNAFVARRRREEYENFLASTNKKTSLFLDIIIESDYDPLAINRMSIKYNDAKLDDPTKKLQRKREEEDQTLAVPGENKLPTSPCGAFREVLPLSLWGAGKIESTPHGFFAKMLDKHRDAGCEDAEAKSYNLKSNVNFDHFNIETGKEVVDRELPKGKRTNFEYLKSELY